MTGKTVGDARFFRRAGPFGLAEIAAAIGAEPSAGAAGAFGGVAPLAAAGEGEISFLDNKRYLPELATTRAGAVILHSSLAAAVPDGVVALVTPTPYRAWALAAALFHPPAPARPGVHRTAITDGAEIDPTAEVGPLAVIGEGARVGPRCRVAAHATIGAGVVLGEDCLIGEHASLSHCLLGRRVRIYPGARIGQDGFGFDPTPTPTGFLSVPQLGRVIVEDDAEIGANSTVDRGSARDTVIGAGSRLDNLVQIGHNVRLGRCCVVVSQAGVAGSTILGDFVMVAAQAGLVGHLRVGDRARIGAQAGVMADIAEGAEVVGSPAQPVRQFFREIAFLRRAMRKRHLEREAE